MLGKTSGPPVSTVATVREITAEAGTLYGAEFTGGTETTLLDSASAKQHEIAKEISLITFRHVIHTILWKEEYDKRLEICNKSPRLQLIATEDRRAKIQRKRWPGAPYLSFVDAKFHARLLAMTRLGTPHKKLRRVGTAYHANRDDALLAATILETQPISCTGVSILQQNV